MCTICNLHILYTATLISSQSISLLYIAHNVFRFIIFYSYLQFYIINCRKTRVYGFRIRDHLQRDDLFHGIRVQVEFHHSLRDDGRPRAAFERLIAVVSGRTPTCRERTYSPASFRPESTATRSCAQDLRGSAVAGVSGFTAVVQNISVVREAGTFIIW